MTVLKFQNKSLLIADEVMVRTLGVASRVARSSASVLLVGESGTGKEMIARFIHEKSERANRAFVSINCAAIPEGLLEAELFGYEKGSFTGATSQRIGKFERASKGTLLLDEISEMPLSLQAKLLRVLQEGEIDRIGGGMPVSIDTRVIATTNRDPMEMIRDGRFREDLYYRLNVARINCLPLRGRKKAIVNLTQAFVRQCSQLHREEELTIDPQALELLVNHKWPGNIRELQNTIERAVLMTENECLEPDDFEMENDNESTPLDRELETLEITERKQIYKALDHTQGNKTKAAKILGISVRTLRNKLNLYESLG